MLVELPKEFYYVWKVFIDLNQARTSNGFGYNPITYTEIDSYCRLMSLELSDEEVSMLRRFDREVLKIYNEELERNNSSKNKK